MYEIRGGHKRDYTIGPSHSDIKLSLQCTYIGDSRAHTGNVGMMTSPVIRSLLQVLPPHLMIVSALS